MTPAACGGAHPRRGRPRRALFGEHGEAQETCEEAGILGPVVGVIGAMQALIAIKQLLGIGDDAARLQLWDALKLSWRRLTIARDPHCRVCGSS